MNYEIDLFKRAREGDQSAAEELFVRYLKESRPIQHCCDEHFQTLEDREEMLHEIYLQLISGGSSFQGKSRLSTYVYRIARVTVFQKYRRENTLKRVAKFIEKSWKIPKFLEMKTPDQIIVFQ